MFSLKDGWTSCVVLEVIGRGIVDSSLFCGGKRDLVYAGVGWFIPFAHPTKVILLLFESIFRFSFELHALISPALVVVLLDLVPLTGMNQTLSSHCIFLLSSCPLPVYHSFSHRTWTLWHHVQIHFPFLLCDHYILQVAPLHPASPFLSLLSPLVRFCRYFSFFFLHYSKWTILLATHGHSVCPISPVRTRTLFLPSVNNALDPYQNFTHFKTSTLCVQCPQHTSSEHPFHSHNLSLRSKVVQM